MVDLNAFFESKYMGFIHEWDPLIIWDTSGIKSMGVDTWTNFENYRHAFTNRVGDEMLRQPHLVPISLLERVVDLADVKDPEDIPSQIYEAHNAIMTRRVLGAYNRNPQHGYLMDAKRMSTTDKEIVALGLEQPSAVIMSDDSDILLTVKELRKHHKGLYAFQVRGYIEEQYPRDQLPIGLRAA